MKIRVNNKDFFFLQSANVSLKLNAVASSFSISVLSDVIKKPLQYDRVELFNDNDELLITGTLVNYSGNSTPKPNAESWDGYSLTGILESVSVPFPLQSDNLSLKEITNKLLAPYNLSFKIDSSVQQEMNEKYTKTTANPQDFVKGYLNNLASQKGILLTHNNKGELLFARQKIGKAVASFDSSLSMSLSVDGSQMHSDITVMQQANSSDPDGLQDTIKNPYLAATFKPVTRIINNGGDNLNDIKKAARMALATELSNIKLSIITTQFIKPGEVVEVLNSEIKINQLTEFIVESTNISFTTSKTVYTLNCVLKDVYDLENYNVKAIW
jgi:prophage tail gpP-like protein